MRRLRILGALGLLPLLVVEVAAVPTASAVPGSSVPGARRAAPPATEFEAASQAEATAVAQVLAARDRRATLEARVDELEIQAGEIGDRARGTAADLARLDVASQNLEARITRIKARLGRAQQRTRRTAADMYREAGQSAPPVLGLLTGSRSVHDVAAAHHYLERAGDRVTTDLRAVRTARRDVLAAARVLRTRRRDVAAAAAAARADQASVMAMRTEQDRALTEARNEEAHETALLVAVRARRAEFERAAVAGQAVSGTIEQILKARPNTGTAPSHFVKPADGPITSAFGPRMHPIFHTVRMHTGVDIGAAYGSTVRAGAAGVVVVAGEASGYGNAIVIDHGGGLATLSGHLSRFAVRVGQTVTAGQAIGAVGNTGNSTGPHLHFEVRVRGVPVDPMPYL